MVNGGLVNIWTSEVTELSVLGTRIRSKRKLFCADCGVVRIWSAEMPGHGSGQGAAQSGGNRQFPACHAHGNLCHRRYHCLWRRAPCENRTRIFVRLVHLYLMQCSLNLVRISCHCHPGLDSGLISCSSDCRFSLVLRLWLFCFSYHLPKQNRGFPMNPRWALLLIFHHNPCQSKWTAGITGIGRFQRRVQVITHRAVRSAGSAWRGFIIPRNMTMRRCRMLCFSTTVLPFMAPTTWETLEGQPRMAVWG